MDTRKHDLDQLRRDYKTEKDPSIRKTIRETAEKISKEGRLINSMRESLIREHRRGNMENVKDIHEYIKNKSKYRDNSR